MNRFEKAIWEVGDFQRQANERMLNESMNQYDDAVVRQQDAQRLNDIKQNVSESFSNILGFMRGC